MIPSSHLIAHCRIIVKVLAHKYDHSEFAYFLMFQFFVGQMTWREDVFLSDAKFSNPEIKVSLVGVFIDYNV